MNATRSRGRHRRGASARTRRVRVLLAAGAALLIAATSTAGSSTASYVDAEYSGGAFAAATLDAITPTITANITSAGASWSASPVGSSPSYSLSRATDSSGTGATTSYAGGGTSTTDSGATASSSQSAYVRTVSAGAAHTCAIADGKVFCWGLNTSGQVGNGTTTSAVSVPTAVSVGSNDVTAVSAGTSHTCAIVSAAVYCWGDNTYGEVGSGSSTTSLSSPQAVAGLSGMTVTAISAGNGFSCAIASGAAYCWGKNGNGQLGIGSTANATTAQAVTGLSAGVSSISAGSGSSACATRYGLAYCWGYNSNGQVGDASTTQRTSPVPVSLTGGSAVLAGHAATAVAVGDSHACAVTDAAIDCWGAGSSGQMGNTSTGTTNSSPVVVSGSSAWSATSITAFGGHTCALASSGLMYCWGLGSSGELGNNSTASTNSSPVSVTSTGALSGVKVRDLSAGSASTCASGQGGLYCWGGNGSYQLGDGTTTTRAVPVSATSPTVAGCADGASLLTGGTCSLAPSTSYWWRLGYTVGPWSSPYSSWIQATTSARDASAPSATSTTATSTTISWSPFTPAGLQTGRYVLQRATDPGGSNLSTLADGAATSFTDITGAGSSGAPTATAVGTGTAGACSIAGDAVWCFGWNGDGQLGNGTTNDDNYAPTRVIGLDGMTITGLGSGATNDGNGHWARCAIANGAAWCWGYNANGQLGNGTSGSGTNSSVPVPVSTSTGLAGKTVTAISSSEEHSCAVTGDGLLFCWGDNQWGQLGINSTTDYNTPQQVTALAGKTVTAVSAGSSRTCAIASGAAYCWGENSGGGVGNNTTTNQWVPVAVNTATMTGTVTAVATGWSDSCAIADARAYCWGYNNKGQLGNGSTTQSSTPVAVSSSSGFPVTGVTAIAAGYEATCAVASGTAWCWGFNGSGQIGNSSTNDSSTPKPVYTGGALSGKTVTAISTGYRKTCAVASGGEYCWGAKAGGLGDSAGAGAAADHSTPLAVSIPTGTICPTGAYHVTATSCSLAADTAYYYRVAYYIGSWTGPTSGWVAVTTSPN